MTTVFQSISDMRARLRRIVHSETVRCTIIGVVMVNAVTLGAETSPSVMAAVGDELRILDGVILGIFVLEILAKILADGWRFFRSGWNWFDFIIVGVALMPSSGTLSVLRALRILRALRLLSIVPRMRTVIEALFAALPGMGAIIAVLGLVFYVAAVLATKLYGTTFPDWFGTIGDSLYSLFQIMTLESWSMGIVRPVMEAHPTAWIFFVPFIIVTSFAVLNLFIGLIVNSMQVTHEEDQKREMAAIHDEVHAETVMVQDEIKALRAEVARLADLLERDKQSS